jgi:hypothetical protein
MQQELPDSGREFAAHSDLKFSCAGRPLSNPLEVKGLEQRTRVAIFGTLLATSCESPWAAAGAVLASG